MGAEVEARFYSAVGLVLNKEFKTEDGRYQTGKFFATGALIHPQVVLTAAHCLQDTLNVGVTLEKTIPQTSELGLLFSKKFSCHPSYETTNHRLDFGLIFLPKPLVARDDLRCPKLISFSPDLPQPYIRYGYGGRNGQNSRVRMEMTFSLENKGGFVLSEDTTGVYGDSGGPVYIERNGEMQLIGIHTGREKDPDTRELKDRSFMTPLTPALIVWMNKIINETRLP